MAVTYKKKLIEAALPLEAINRACVEDKNRKTGHIRNLHKWFAPMPLPAWRAVLFASLVDDPATYLPEAEVAAERDRLFKILERLLPFEAIYDGQALSAARAEIRRCMGNELPVIADPFCGGGSTVVEAQRLGLPTFASDLNPIPVIITKMLVEIPPKIRGIEPLHPTEAPDFAGSSHLQGFVGDVRHYAQRIREKAWGRLSPYYPPATNGDEILAWRWCRTVSSPDPTQRGAHTPLVSDWWLSKKQGASAWIQPVSNGREIDYKIKQTGQPPPASVGRNGAQCLFSGSPIPLPYIRAEGKAQRLGVRLMASVVRGADSRWYEPPTDRQIEAARKAVADTDVSTALPERALGFRVQEYGFASFEDLFTSRQQLALSTFAELVADIRDEIAGDAAKRKGRHGAAKHSQQDYRLYADAIITLLSLCVGRMAQSNNSLIRWAIDARNGSSKAVPAFDRHALAMIWDFTEVNPFGGSVGDWTAQLETCLRALPLVDADGPAGEVRQLDARDISVLAGRKVVVATDPPYFANIGYADLADFFYLWIRKALRTTYPDLLATISTPKSNELIATPFRHGGSMDAAKAYFQAGFEAVFTSVSALQTPDVPISVVYAFKQEEDSEEGGTSTGWEAMLEGLIRSNLTVVATWPLRTNRATRMIGLGTNALASAVVILCRVREVAAEITSRRAFVHALHAELPIALKALQGGNIAPVDLAQAAIGPGMAVFSRYARVLETDGSRMSVRTALALINQTLDEVLAEQETEFDADTQWALAWFDQYGFNEGTFGDAEGFSRAKNTSVAGMATAGIVAAKAGKVRLLKKEELPIEWDPATDTRLTVWEMTHQLSNRLEKSELSAAQLLKTLGSMADVARDLAYRLFNICERKKWARDAMPYNALVLAWPELSRLAQERRTAAPVQGELV